MAERVERRPVRPINPLHGILIASTLPLFLGAVLSNWAYARTAEVQWTNFASWLVAGGLVFAGLALVWALLGLVRRRRGWLYPVLVILTFLCGFLTSLVLAKDAWAAMPAAFILSIVLFLLAVAANWAAHSGHRAGDRA